MSAPVSSNARNGVAIPHAPFAPLATGTEVPILAIWQMPIPVRIQSHDKARFQDFKPATHRGAPFPQEQYRARAKSRATAAPCRRFAAVCRHFVFAVDGYPLLRLNCLGVLQRTQRPGSAE